MRCPFAVWRGPIPNQRVDGVARPTRGFVFHVIVGTLSAADSVFHNPNYQASAHFGIGKDGTVYQWVDTDDRAWAEGSGNPEWLSCETEGQPSEPLTNAQVAMFARLFNWGQVHGPYPYLVTDSPTGRGLGTHSMGGSAWGGHECPGAIRAAQRPLILQTAAGGQPTPPQEEDMAHSWERVIYPGQARWINVPPPEEGAFPGHAMFASVGVDAFDAPSFPARVVAGRPGAWYAPAVEGAEVPIRTGRTLVWRLRKGDQGVSIVNRARPYDPNHPELGPNLSFLFECA